MRKTIAIFAFLILFALIAVFRGKSSELPGVVDLTPGHNAGVAGIAAPAAGPGAPSSGTPGGTGAPAPVAPGTTPAPAVDQGLPAAAREIIHSNDAQLVRGKGELGAMNAHAQFVASAGPGPLLAAAARTAAQAADCLKRGACLEAPSENRAYFDPENTAPQRLLAQSLRLLLDGANAGALPDGIPIGEEALLDIVRVGNEESRLLALELLLQGSPEDSIDRLDRVLAERNLFQGNSGRVFYSLVRESTDGSQVLRSHFMRALSDTWSNGDPETVLELVRHADQLGLNEQEYDQSVSKLCRFTAPSYPKANWRAIRHHLENLRTNRGFQRVPSAICKA